MTTHSLSQILFRFRLHTAIHTIVLLASILALLGLTGWLLAGTTGLWFTLFAGAWAFFLARRAAPSLTLRAHRAVPLPPHRAPQLHLLMQELSRRADLPQVPALFVSPDDVPNAFALGTPRNDPTVVLTDGLLRTVDLRELGGILAHELAHLKNGDVPLMNMAAVARSLVRSMAFVGTILLLLNLPLVLVGSATVPWALVLVLTLGPVAALLLQLALSRTREFGADMRALEITGDPLGLARALRRVERATQPWFRAMFWAETRLPKPPRLLRSHPDTDERIERILAVASAV